MTPLLNSAGRKLYVLRHVSTGATINLRAVWPNANEDQPISGLDPDLQYLPILTEGIPDYDPAHFTLAKAEGPNGAGDKWEIKYTTPDRPKEEVKALAENAKRFVVGGIYPQADFTETVVLTLAAVLRQAKGLELTPQERALADTLIEKAALMRRHDDTLEQLKAQIDAGEKPSFADAWPVAP